MASLPKRLLNVFIALLALYAFFTIPIGTKTGAQHVVAIFSTDPAKEAGRALSEIAREAAAKVLHNVDELSDELKKKTDAPEPVDSNQPASSSSAKTIRRAKR